MRFKAVGRARNHRQPGAAVPRRARLLLTALTAFMACKQTVSNAPVLVLDIVGLEVPQLPGWHPDPIPRLSDPAKGGLILRLVGESSGVPGAPRIDVHLAPKGTHPPILETFLTENLRAMGELESKGRIRIVDVTQEPFRIGATPAYRVRHNYTLNQGAAQISISQVSAFVVIGERALTITAAGRTELFHSVAQSVESTINGLRIVGDNEKSLPVDVLRLEEAGKKNEAPAPEQLRPLD